MKKNRMLLVLFSAFVVIGASLIAVSFLQKNSLQILPNIKEDDYVQTGADIEDNKENNEPQVTATPQPSPSPKVTPTPKVSAEPDDPEEPVVEIPTEYTIENIDYINQVEKYPTGCESVAAVMGLNYMGVDISVDTFIDDYLDKGNRPYYSNDVLYASDPWEKFIGNPKSSKGYGCFSPVIENAINKFIDTDIYKIEVYNEFTTQISLKEICDTYISQDVPVLIWATASMKSVRNSTHWTIEGTNEKYQWISPMHCLLLVGYDEDNYYFHDSLESEYKKYSKEKVETAYKAMGEQALAVIRK